MEATIAMDNLVVLYVEDEEDDFFFMFRAFEQEGLGKSLRRAVDGEDAIDYLEGKGCYADRDSHPFPHLILLDLNLPARSGFEILAWMGEQQHVCDIPVVVFSSSGHGKDRERARKLGARDYLLKPSSGLAFPETVRVLKRNWLNGRAPLKGG